MHPPQPPALSRTLKENQYKHIEPKKSALVVLHCQVTFPFLFLLKTKSQGSCPRLVECFATESLTKMYNYLIASILEFFTVTWIWAIWGFSAKHHWLTLPVYLWLYSPFPKTDSVNLGRRVVAISMFHSFFSKSSVLQMLGTQAWNTSSIKLFFLLCFTVNLSHKAYHSMTKTPFQPAATSLIYFSSGSYSFRLKYMPLDWIKHRNFNCLNIFYG